MSGHERFEALLMREVDGVLDATGRDELERHLEQCEQCRGELEDFRRIKQTTDTMTARILADAHIEPPRPQGSTKLLMRLSFAALLAGLLLLLGSGARELALDASLPWPLKLGAGLLAAGTLGLLGHLIRLRIAASGRDPYEEIDQ
jgi:anti-sigma factor RsiW